MYKYDSWMCTGVSVHLSCGITFTSPEQSSLLQGEDADEENPPKNDAGVQHLFLVCM